VITVLEGPVNQDIKISFDWLREFHKTAIAFLIVKKI